MGGCHHVDAVNANQTEHTCTNVRHQKVVLVLLTPVKPQHGVFTLRFLNRLKIEERRC